MKKELISFSRITSIILTTLFLSASSVCADNYSPEVIEHLGKKIPLNLKFVNSRGEQILLKNLIKKPTVIDFVYYKCPGICTPLMMEVADVISKVKYEPGKDYNIISISIDQNETPEMAAEKKRAMIGMSTKRIPDYAWTFLTGDSVSIFKLANAAGFGFERNYYGFLHKGVLIFVDKTGKIVQYMNPGYIKENGDFQILPSAFELAIRKATTGEVTSTLAKVLQTCYSFVPKGRSMVVLLLVLISGLLTVTAVFIIVKKANIRRRS
jgi:protein SCO1/2